MTNKCNKRLKIYNSGIYDLFLDYKSNMYNFLSISDSVCGFFRVSITGRSFNTALTGSMSFRELPTDISIFIEGVKAPFKSLEDFYSFRNDLITYNESKSIVAHAAYGKRARRRRRV
jgi:hypothetical protein